jgi:hypothetical protein
MSSIDSAFPRMALYRSDPPAFDERALSDTDPSVRVVP